MQRNAFQLSLHNPKSFWRYQRCFHPLLWWGRAVDIPSPVMTVVFPGMASMHSGCIVRGYDTCLVCVLFTGRIRAAGVFLMIEDTFALLEDAGFLALLCKMRLWSENAYDRYRSGTDNAAVL